MVVQSELFKTDRTLYRYGLEEVPADISKRELLAYFSLNKEQVLFIKTKFRLNPYRIALGIQLGAHRFIGRPQFQPENVPLVVIKFVGRALKIRGDFIPLKYSDSIRIRQVHAQIVRKFLGLSLFPTSEHQNLIDYLIQTMPDPGHFPDWIKKTEDHLRKRKFVLPSIKVLRRLILSARNQSLNEAVNSINSILGEKRIEALEGLLLSGEDNYTKWFELTNRQVYSSTPAKVTSILGRIKTIRQLSLNTINFDVVSNKYLQHFAQRGMHLSAKQLRDQSSLHRYAIMAATLKELESELTDITIQMNDEILSGVFQRGKWRSENHFRKNKKIIRKIISAFKLLSDTILDQNTDALQKIEYIEKELPPDTLQNLRNDSDCLDVPRGTEDIYFASEGYQTIQKYLPDLLETIRIISPSKRDPALEAAKYYLKRKQEGKAGIGADAPTDFVQEKKWKHVVLSNNSKPKTKPWILCLADGLRKSFRQGSLEIEGARQYRSLNSDLISWEEFKNTTIKEDESLPFTATPEKVIIPLFRTIQELSGQYRRWLAEQTATIDENHRIHLKKLDKIEEPESATKLRPLLYKKMPSRSLPEIFVEADRLTGFSSYLTRLSSGQPIQKGEKTRGRALYAVLQALTCDIPLSKMAICSGIPLEILRSIHEDIIRPQTLKAGMITLVDFYSRLPLAQVWGSGKTSSSDGQGFPAEGHPLGASFNKKRFQSRRMGFIIYTHIADNNAPFYVQIIPGGAREAIHVPDGLLYHGTSLMPREHYTDSHGFTEVVFAVLYLLGFRLAPRIANIPDKTLWYGKNYEVEYPELFDGSIPLNSIASQWEAMRRFMLTIHTGEIRASQLIRKISAFSRKHPLLKAFRNLGRLLITRHILEVAGDPDFRRRIFQGLNKGESKNSLSVDLRYVKKGAIREKDPEMQLCVASALNLTTLCIAICNTVDMQNAIRALKREGYNVNPEDLRFFSPYAHGHHNIYGRFYFHGVPGTHLDLIEKAFEPL